MDKFIGYIGHRGSLGYGVENTTEAFLGAVKRNVWGIECDIRISSDKQVFIMHDDTLERFFIKNSSNVWDYSLKELQNFTLKQEFNNKIYYGKITTFEDYLKICLGYHKRPIVEIKYSAFLNDITIADFSLVWNLIMKYHLEKQVIIISFMKSCLIKIRKCHPDLTIQLLTCGKIDYELADCQKYNFHLNTCLDKTVTKENIQKYHDHNLLVNVWTIDNSQEAEKLQNLKVNFITSNLLF